MMESGATLEEIEELKERNRIRRERAAKRRQLLLGGGDPDADPDADDETHAIASGSSSKSKGRTSSGRKGQTPSNRQRKGKKTETGKRKRGHLSTDELEDEEQDTSAAQLDSVCLDPDEAERASLELVAQLSGKRKRGGARTSAAAATSSVANTPKKPPRKRGRRQPVSKEKLLEVGEAILQLILDQVERYEDSDEVRRRAELFEKLPTKAELPHYYATIKKPVDLNRIRVRLKRGTYTTLTQFRRDIELCW
eukprot:CAMPEP_0177662128 /NCGR_PEP_ID=MMETSP0447-20121125/19097_1 /TAXON_ID=0 /ORGANISM="Stygamoeba regulata, Strain BSH-02190019" /LENGTH=251 /DNA_ID=CAMNT_0019167617 /DNA_START=12 /DNA_END=764 /DNA_ORIENTATION=-